MTTHRWRGLLALALSVTLVGAACNDDTTTETGGSDTTEAVKAVEGSTIRFAPQDFPESKTLTEVYSQYLQAKGFEVEVQPASGFRDQVYPGMWDDDLDIIIDYTGSARRFLDPELTALADPDETYDSLTGLLGKQSLVAYEYAEAEDANALVALKSWAEENSVTTISDLAAVEGLVLGADEDCRDRPDCLLGYQDVYGIEFSEFKALEYGPPLTEALVADEVQVAQYQTTAPQIASGDFVVLEDDKGLLSADNVVPVSRQDLSDEYGAALADALNELSGMITTDDLIGWNVSTDIDKDEPADVATAWLEGKGLL